MVLIFKLKWSVLRTLGICPLLGPAAGIVLLGHHQYANASTDRRAGRRVTTKDVGQRLLDAMDGPDAHRG
jgi:hypothetical protein